MPRHVSASEPVTCTASPTASGVCSKPRMPGGDVARVGDGPQARAVAREDDVRAPAHAIHERPRVARDAVKPGILEEPYVWAGRTMVHGRPAAVPAVAQRLLARDLVSRVLPVLVLERHVLRERTQAILLAVRRGGRDEHVAVGERAEGLDVVEHLLRAVRDELHHGVEPLAAQARPAQRRPQGLRRRGVCVDDVRSRRARQRRLSAIDEGHVMPFGEGQTRHFGRNESGATNQQDAHGPDGTARELCAGRLTM